MKISDFRSDTVTQPDEEMRQAMARAVVGDDVFGEDPTVKELEEKAAEIFGKEAALFLPSGTMANQVAVFCHTQAGDEVILERDSHIYNFEVGGLAVISRVQVHPIVGEQGVMSPEDVERAIRPKNLHLPRTSLICLENTHNLAGGKVLPLENIRAIWEIAKTHNVRVHIDGARIFNACCASGISPREYAHYCHSLSFCLSKGLGAPVGSLLVGDKEWIEEARRVRKMLGGGMRQAGVLAACGLIALERREQLTRDHHLARQLTQGLSQFPQIHIEEPETNIVMVYLSPPFQAEEFVQRIREKGVLAVAIRQNLVRFVTHKDVDEQDVQRAIEAVGSVLEKSQRSGP